MGGVSIFTTCPWLKVRVSDCVFRVVTGSVLLLPDGSLLMVVPIASPAGGGWVPGPWVGRSDCPCTVFVVWSFPIREQQFYRIIVLI